MKTSNIIKGKWQKQMLQLYESVRKITELLNLTFYNIFSKSCFTVKNIKKSTPYCSLFKENPFLLPQFFSFQLQFFLRFENHLWIKQNKLYVRRFILFFTYFSAFVFFSHLHLFSRYLPSKCRHFSYTDISGLVGTWKRMYTYKHTQIFL